MANFRKIRRFTGGKNRAEYSTFLQFKENSQANWADVLDITKLGPVVEEIPWESESDASQFEQVQQATSRPALR